jgi:immune inhibitor A
VNKRHWSAASGLAVGALVVTGLSVPMQAQASQASGAPSSGDPAKTTRTDNFPTTLGDAQAKLTQDAVKQLVTGDATTTTVKGNRVIKLEAKDRKGQTRYVNYPTEREEDIFTILTDFGDKVLPATGGTAGPVHNSIPEPDRVWDGNATDDNSTYWTKNFDRQHYVDMMFGDGESFKDFYLKQSNGRFLAKGDVSDWVTVPYNEARYGHNPVKGDGTSEAGGYWNYIKDTATAWYADQVKQGKSLAEIKAYLAQFDKVDRYDFDHDGDFNEPDGYIDHFQAIHAGEGEEAGGGAQGADAIWSHRWFAWDGYTDRGPAANKNGGVPIGDSGLWIGDYTTEPENGGLGVFTHEFGHDLGLPDLYDTQGGDNGTGFWTLMSAGSWLNHGGNSIGTTPGYMGPWEKLQLGWLDYTTIPFGEDRNIKLGRADMGSAKGEQAAVLPLPERTVVTKHNTPHSGAGEWWTGFGNNVSATLTRDLDLTGGSAASVDFWLSGSIEVGYDTLRGEVSTDGGKTWTVAGGPVDGSLDDKPKEEDNDLAWTKVSWDLSAYAGKSVQFRFRFDTDGGVGSEAFIDDVAVTVGTTTTTDDVENGAGAWTAAGGFQIINGTTSRQVQDMYLVENRTYGGYDDTLRTGPYNFGWANTKPDWVERFPYQNGMLVWFANGEYGDNNTSVHPGGGQVLPVDARPAPITFPGGFLLGNRRQPFDATFGQEATDAVTFHRNGVPTTVPSRPGIPMFDDSDVNRYWSADNPWNSTKVAGSGTSLTVFRTNDGGDQLQVKVRFR